MLNYPEEYKQITNEVRPGEELVGRPYIESCLKSIPDHIMDTFVDKIKDD